MFICLFNRTATTGNYTYLHTLSLHDALPISSLGGGASRMRCTARAAVCSCSCGASVASPTRTCSPAARPRSPPQRSEEHTSELQSLMRISYAVFCLKQKIIHHHHAEQLIKHVQLLQRIMNAKYTMTVE